MDVGILNVTGYSGMELARILRFHPEVNLVGVTGRSAVGEELSTVLPHLKDMDLIVEDEISASVDLVFSALPQVASAEACLPYIENGVRVVDISADFRLHDPQEYQLWYGSEHPSPTLLASSVYGITELEREKIAGATIVANPGCYPTASLLALAPAVKAGFLKGGIIIDAKSGVSGSGRGLSMTTHFSEVNENVFAYGISGHRHLPEITQELARYKDGFDPNVTFTPHLIPMTRGVFVSIYAEFLDGLFVSVDDSRRAISEIYEDFYKDDRFVRVVDYPPQTKQTWGSNDCLIYPTVDQRSGRFIIFAALDNLIKGAAGQAVQNMNVMLGLPDFTGLEHFAVYP
jgi:N-acetyl-gamma-glutamyl-phosphate reductase